MSCVDVLSNLSSLYEYKIISDLEGNEFILLHSSTIESIDFPINDRTAFEANENHVHIIEKIRKREIPELASVSKTLSMSILRNLKSIYPDRDFLVFVTMKPGDSLIIRFHQKWNEEEPYYDPQVFKNTNELVLMFKS